MLNPVTTRIGDLLEFMHTAQARSAWPCLWVGAMSTGDGVNHHRIEPESSAWQCALLLLTAGLRRLKLIAII